MLEKYLAAYPADAARVDAWLARIKSSECSPECAAELRAQAEIHALNLLWWRRLGHSLAGDAVCGHSLGYYAALVAAGVIDEETSFSLLAGVLRTLWPTFAEHTQPIRVLTVRQATDLAALAARHGMELIAENNSMQGVFYGSNSAWDALVGEVGDDLLRAVSLPTRVPFHSEVIAAHADALQAAVDAAVARPGACELTLWSHIDAGPLENSTQALRLAAVQPYRAVRWAQLVGNLCGSGAHEFVEVGPNRTLTQIARLSMPQVEARFIDHLRH